MIRSVFLSTIIVQMKQSLSRPMFRFCLFANPIFNTLLLYGMYQNRLHSMDFSQFVLIGAGIMGVWSCICFSSIGDINREKYGGTLAPIFCAPAGFGNILFGKLIGNTILSMLSFAIAFLTAIIIQSKKSVLNISIYIPISLIMLILTFILVSAMLALMLVLTRKTELYMNFLELPVIFLCGIVFPVRVLPKFLRFFSFLLPPTHAVDLFRIAMVKNIDLKEYWSTFLILSIFILFMCLAIALLFKFVDRQVRILGTLEVV